MPTESPFAAVFENTQAFPRTTTIFKDLTVENQNRLILQAGSKSLANENLYFFIELQKLSNLNTTDFEISFKALALRLKNTELNVDNEVQKLLVDLEKKGYSNSLANDVLTAAKTGILSSLKNHFFFRVELNTRSPEEVREIAKNPKTEQNDPEINLNILKALLPNVEATLKAMEKNLDHNAIQKLMGELGIDKLDKMQQRLFFEMITRDLLRENHQQIVPFLKVAENYLASDQKNFETFAVSVAMDIGLISEKNAAMFKVAQFFLPRLEKAARSGFAHNAARQFSQEEAEQLLSFQWESIEKQLSDKTIKPIESAIRADSYKAIHTEEKQSSFDIPSGPLSKISKAYDKAQDNIYKYKFIFEYAKRLQISYLYNQQGTLSGVSKNKKETKKVNLQNVLKDIETFKDNPEVSIREVEALYDRLEQAAQDVKNAANERHTSQISHRLFGKIMKNTSNTEDAIDNAQKGARAAISPPRSHH